MYLCRDNNNNSYYSNLISTNNLATLYLGDRYYLFNNYNSSKYIDGLHFNSSMLLNLYIIYSNIIFSNNQRIFNLMNVTIISYNNILLLQSSSILVNGTIYNNLFLQTNYDCIDDDNNDNVKLETCNNCYI